jgi:hypothetical protein
MSRRRSRILTSSAGGAMTPNFAIAAISEAQLAKTLPESLPAEIRQRNFFQLASIEAAGRSIGRGCAHCLDGEMSRGVR